MTTHNVNIGSSASASASTRIGDKVETVSSTSDERVVNNVMRHEYRVLTDAEKTQMQQIKDKGLEFWQMIDAMGKSRELSLAQTKIEEAVMWAVKNITK
jgi:hypothetical protein